MCTPRGNPDRNLHLFYLNAIYFQNIIPALLQEIEKDKYDRATDKWEGRVREVQGEKEKGKGGGSGGGGGGAA